MALGGVLAALAVVIMALGTLIPVATYVCPVLCMLLLQAVNKLCGSRVAWAWYGAVAILSMLLAPDKEKAAILAPMAQIRDGIFLSRQELTRYVLRHASYYWTIGIDKSALGWEDSYFGVKCTEAREPGTGGSLGAYTSAAQAIESMWIIERNQ